MKKKLTDHVLATLHGICVIENKNSKIKECMSLSENQEVGLEGPTSWFFFIFFFVFLEKEKAKIGIKVVLKGIDTW
jgi:hypothetical protein